jgi:hypothetical protein
MLMWAALLILPFLGPGKSGSRSGPAGQMTKMQPVAMTARRKTALFQKRANKIPASHGLLHHKETSACGAESRPCGKLRLFIELRLVMSRLAPAHRPPPQGRLLRK